MVLAEVKFDASNIPFASMFSYTTLFDFVYSLFLSTTCWELMSISCDKPTQSFQACPWVVDSGISRCVLSGYNMERLTSDNSGCRILELGCVTHFAR